MKIDKRIAQAKHDARPDELPAVFSRRNHSEWLVTMELDAWIELYKEFGVNRWIEERGETHEKQQA